MRLAMRPNGPMVFRFAAWGALMMAASLASHYAAVGAFPGKGYQWATVLIAMTGPVLAVAFGLVIPRVSHLVQTTALIFTISYYKEHNSGVAAGTSWFLKTFLTEDLIPRLAIGLLIAVVASRASNAVRMTMGAVLWVAWDPLLASLWNQTIPILGEEDWLLNAEKAFAVLVMVPPGGWMTLDLAVTSRPRIAQRLVYPLAFLVCFGVGGSGSIVAMRQREARQLEEKRISGMNAKSRKKTYAKNLESDVYEAISKIDQP